MRPKRKPSEHQKRIRFFTLLFGALAVLIPLIIIWFMNRPPGSH
jgi:hypothetical protein